MQHGICQKRNALRLVTNTSVSEIEARSEKVLGGLINLHTVAATFRIVCLCIISMPLAANLHAFVDICWQTPSINWANCTFILGKKLLEIWLFRVKLYQTLLLNKLWLICFLDI